MVGGEGKEKSATRCGQEGRGLIKKRVGSSCGDESNTNGGGPRKRGHRGGGPNGSVNRERRNKPGEIGEGCGHDPGSGLQGGF